MNRIALGTVQLGLPYGARAGATLMPAEEAERILDAAWELGVRAFDTAEAYGCAAERLSAWLRRRNRLEQCTVTTKIIPQPTDRGAQVRAALDRFEGVRERVLLTHGFTTEPQWTEVAKAACEAGAAAGESVYDPAEVSAAAALPGIARIQAPANLFDDRAFGARGDAPVALDLRSAFLQGVLLLDAEGAERRAPGAGPLASAVSAAARACGEEPASLLLASLLRRLRGGDRIVLGADSPGHLQPLPRAEALASTESLTVDAFEREALARAGVPDARTLDPRTWA